MICTHHKRRVRFCTKESFFILFCFFVSLFHENTPMAVKSDKHKSLTQKNGNDFRMGYSRMPEQNGFASENLSAHKPPFRYGLKQTPLLFHYRQEDRPDTTAFLVEFRTIDTKRNHTKTTVRNRENSVKSPSKRVRDLTKGCFRNKITVTRTFQK